MTAPQIVGPPWTVTATGTIRYRLHDLMTFAGLKPEGDDRLLSTSQAAKYLGYHHVSLRKWRTASQRSAA